jgi:excinuclease ABC subunit A
VADYIIDVGPECGSKGGQIIAEGTPEQIVKVKDSHTGRFLKIELG